MQVWIASFILLFALAELFQWLKDFTLPLPIFILGGVFLAIASNSEKIPGLSSSFFPQKRNRYPHPLNPHVLFPLKFAVLQNQILEA
uniref:Uncharacterized protein n=1 Tax=Desertifilum tharense IPPAS B-1220 TaxID=1781255 RepID=A0ACD5GZN9_9CYAN